MLSEVNIVLYSDDVVLVVWVITLQMLQDF